MKLNGKFAHRKCRKFKVLRNIRCKCEIHFCKYLCFTIPKYNLLFFQIKYYNLFYKIKNCILFLNWFQVLHHLLHTGYNLVITSILSSSEKMNWIKISCFQRKRKMDWRYLSKYKWRHNSIVKSAALSSSRYINSFLLFF